MPFKPATISLDEAGRDAPYKWKMTKPLTWTGTFRGEPGHVEVPTTEGPFTTDLASVPRSLTWLFPRYGKYTKAAVLHDYLCQNFRKAPSSKSAASLLPLEDRSDADELFRHLMAELGVPWIRRRLMWTAVSWATLFTSLVPGRRSRPVLRWVGRFVALGALVAAGWLLTVRHDRVAVVMCAFGLPAALLLSGAIALGRADRASAAVVMYPITLFFSPLLATGVAVAISLLIYLTLEDVVRGLPATRGLLRDLFSKEAKMAKLATPQFARLAEVLES